MKAKALEKILEYLKGSGIENLMDNHSQAEMAKVIQKHFKFSLVHAEKDGMIKIYKDDQGNERIKLLKSEGELDAWFKSEKATLQTKTIN